MSVIRRHPLAAFFVLAIALTWSLVPIGSFAAFGPAVAAVVITVLIDGRAGLRSWGRRIVRWRVGWRWYIVAVGLPLAVLTAAVGLNFGFGAPVSAVDQLDPWYSLLLVFALRLIVPLFAPLGEEPGWRGFALVRLQAARTPLQATLILAPVVALWHVPLIFLASENLAPILLVATIAVTFFYTWLFNRTGGSVFMTIVAHAVEGTITLGAFGFVGADESRLPWLYTAAWCAVAVGLLVFDWGFWNAREGASVKRLHAKPAPAAA